MPAIALVGHRHSCSIHGDGAITAGGINVNGCAYPWVPVGAPYYADDPQLKGLVDRYHAHAYAQVLLLDQPVFPDTNGVLQFLPEDYQVKDEEKR